MNWLDIILLVILALSVIWGLRTDLIGGMFTGLGVFVGWVLAGQLADDIGAFFDASLNSDTLVTVLSYIIIIIVSVVIIRSIGKIVKPILIVGTLGTVGLGAKLGGLALGFIIGLALGGILITGLARLAYNFALPTPSINVPGITGTTAGEQASNVTKALDLLKPRDPKDIIEKLKDSTDNFHIYTFGELKETNLSLIHI